MSFRANQPGFMRIILGNDVGEAVKQHVDLQLLLLADCLKFAILFFHSLYLRICGLAGLASFSNSGLSTLTSMLAFDSPLAFLTLTDTG